MELLCSHQKGLFRLWTCYGGFRGVVAMLLSRVSLTKSKSKTILVKMIRQARTGYSFNIEKLTMGETDSTELWSSCKNKSTLLGTEKKTLLLNNGLKMHLIYERENRGQDTDSEILHHIIREKNDTITASYAFKDIEGKQWSESMRFILDHIYH